MGGDTNRGALQPPDPSALSFRSLKLFLPTTRGTCALTLLIWTGIALCLTQSATLSGLNLACFRVSKLRLEIEAAQGNPQAVTLLELREDANFLLVTILWANVSVNVLLALLSGSVLAGVAAFFFSTVVITIVGEIFPQAYFSRHALQVVSTMAPVLRFYQVLLYPVARLTAIILDRWLGEEAIPYFEEADLRDLIRMHAQAAETEISRVEGAGALNFLDLDDLPLSVKGEPVDPESVVELEFRDGRPVFPEVAPTPSDPFLNRIHRSGRTWTVVVDTGGHARLVLDSDSFLRAALFDDRDFDPLEHCHRPILVQDGGTRLGTILPQFRISPEHPEDDVLEEDIILLWGEDRRIITGSDILGRLLRGIVKREGEAPS